MPCCACSTGCTTPTEARTAFAAARHAGFDNISLDFMYGLPGQSLQHWRDTLEQALDMGAEHLSLYALTLEHNVPMARRVAAGEHITCPTTMRLPTCTPWPRICWSRQAIVTTRSPIGRPARTLSRVTTLSTGGASPTMASAPAPTPLMGATAAPTCCSRAATLPPCAAAHRRWRTVRHCRPKSPWPKQCSWDFVSYMRESPPPDSPRSTAGHSSVFAPQIAALVDEGLLVDDGERLLLTRRGRLLSNQVFIRFMA